MLTGILAPSGGVGTVAGFDVRTEAEKIKAHIGYARQRVSAPHEGRDGEVMCGSRFPREGGWQLDVLLVASEGTLQEAFAAALRLLCSVPHSSRVLGDGTWRSEEHTSELKSLMRLSYAVCC